MVVKLEHVQRLWYDVQTKYLQHNTVSSVKCRNGNSSVRRNLLKVKPFYFKGRKQIYFKGRKQNKIMNGTSTLFNFVLAKA